MRKWFDSEITSDDVIRINGKLWAIYRLDHPEFWKGAITFEQTSSQMPVFEQMAVDYAPEVKVSTSYIERYIAKKLSNFNKRGGEAPSHQMRPM